MEKHLTVDDYDSIIDMINATEEDITIALEVLKTYNRFSTYIVAMDFCTRLKKRILNNINEHENLDTSINTMYWMLYKHDYKFKNYKKLFKHIVLIRLKNASKHSNLNEVIKHIKTELNV